MRWQRIAWLVLFGLLLGSRATAAPAPFIIEQFQGSAKDVAASAITSGANDARFGAYDYRQARKSGPFWLKLTYQQDWAAEPLPALVVHKGRHLSLQPFVRREGRMEALSVAAELASFSGVHDAIYALPGGVRAGDAVYVRVEASGTGAEQLRFAASTLRTELAQGAEHLRMIALAVGALLAVSLAALLIWFVLKDPLFILYASLFTLHALYITYLSGQGFDWPVLSWAAPLTSHMWNVPAALGGAISCLFIREIADLKHFSPRIYRIFGGFSVVFVVLAFANLGRYVGLGGIVSMIGNVIFLAAAVFTLTVALLAWRRGSRAAGWFLIAWVLLEAFVIATAVSLLLTAAENAEGLLYYGLPLSMVAAAILVALGVADRLRDQRNALSVAEQHAQIDGLTGVLNRRSLIERLDAACARAKARDLPISLLFIDLDHFKAINDTFGHPAGDACLAAVIAPIQAELRQSDVIGRYGGEEFVVILSSADSAAAHPIAERIRERVAAVQVDGFGAPIRLTCSIGVAASDTLGLWGEHLIARADAAVYAAKRSGRNCVEIAPPLAA